MPSKPVLSKRAALIFCASLGAAVLWPAQASAQHARVFVSAGYFARPAYFGYSPFFYDPFFYGVGWSQWYPYPYPPPYYYGRRYDISEARLEIKPRNAQAFWPECNPLIRRRVCDLAAGIPDYNATVHITPILAGERVAAGASIAAQ